MSSFSADVITTRFGRRSQNKDHRENKQGKPDTGVLPLLGCDEDDIMYVRRTNRKRKTFRVASRCQVSTSKNRFNIWTHILLAK